MGKVPKSWLADEPRSDVRKLPERADEVKAPNTEPASEQVSVKSADDELIDEPDEEIALSKNIDCDVDSTRPRETSRREM